MFFPFVNTEQTPQLKELCEWNFQYLAFGLFAWHCASHV